MATTRPVPAHDLLLCGLDLLCLEVAVVSVVEPDAEPEWGCELHAGKVLENASRAQIMSVGDRDAACRLLALPWNTHDSRPVL